MTPCALREKKVVAVATSAVAAVLLDEGRTARRQDTDTHYCREHMQHFRQIAAGTRPLDTDFIIWDEIVMCHRYCVEAVDRSLLDIT